MSNIPSAFLSRYHCVANQLKFRDGAFDMSSAESAFLLRGMRQALRWPSADVVYCGAVYLLNFFIKLITLIFPPSLYRFEFPLSAPLIDRLTTLRWV